MEEYKKHVAAEGAPAALEFIQGREVVTTGGLHLQVSDDVPVTFTYNKRTQTVILDNVSCFCYTKHSDFTEPTGLVRIRGEYGGAGSIIEQIIE